MTHYCYICSRWTNRALRRALFGVLFNVLLTMSGLIEGKEAIEGAKKMKVFSKEPFAVPSINFSDLKALRHIDDVTTALTTHGMIAVTQVNPSMSSIRQRSLQGLCECFHNPRENNDLMGAVSNTDVAMLDDGVTTRSTLATATANGIPLPLPSNELVTYCGRSSLPDDLDVLRDITHEASSAFINMMDVILRRSNGEHSMKGNDGTLENEAMQAFPLLRNVHGRTYDTIKSIVQESQNLEHFHVYDKHHQGQEDAVSNDDRTFIDEALKVHTDAGLFLSFIPAMTCGNEQHNASLGSTQEDSSFMAVIDGVLRPVVFQSEGDNTVIMMLGEGAEHWLKNQESRASSPFLKATRHAVRMRPGDKRAWYGMMHLVPLSAVIQDEPYQLTFSDLRQGIANSNPLNRSYDLSAPNEESMGNTAIGCGLLTEAGSLGKGDGDNSVHSALSMVKNRRRLEMVPDASYCNNSTNFFCWMSCLDIPNQENIVEYQRHDEPRLYCMDPTLVGASTGTNKKAAVDACEDGWAHNTNCLGVWNAPIENAPYQKNFDVPDQGGHNNRTDDKAAKAPLCAGGTSMYMDGFHWRHSVCVIYLIPNFVLNTMGKFVGAAFGTLGLGISVEYAILGRKTVLARISHPMGKLCASTLLYGIQLTLAYLLMLVVMTYSGPLFLCCVLGLMVGHFMVNYRNQVQNKGTSGDGNGGDTIEGATPCCQNDVSGVRAMNAEASQGAATTDRTARLSSNCDDDDITNDDFEPSQRTEDNPTTVAPTGVQIVSITSTGPPPDSIKNIEVQPSCCCGGDSDD